MTNRQLIDALIEHCAECGEVEVVFCREDKQDRMYFAVSVNELHEIVVRKIKGGAA